MAERTITVQMPDDLPALNLREALKKAIPEAIIWEWLSLLRTHTASGAGMASLTLDKALDYPFKGDLDSVGVVSTEPGVEWLDRGRAAFHLPDHWGRRKGKWKGVTKDGRRWAIVRLPVYTPGGEGQTTTRRRLGGTMPSEVYESAKLLGDYSTARAAGQSGDRLSGYGDDYKQAKSYDYYRQLFGDDARELPVDESGNPVHHYDWRTSPFEGMMRSLQQNPETGSKGSEYFVLRTIVEGSPGWWIPPTPAYHFSEVAIDKAWPAIEAIADAALAADMQSALGAALEGLNQ